MLFGVNQSVRTAVEEELGLVSKLADLTSDESRRAQAIQIRSVIDSSSKLLVIGILASLTMAVSAAWDSHATGWRSFFPWLWWGPLALGMIGAIFHAGKVASIKTVDAILREGRIAVVGSFYLGACWGSSVWLLLPAETPRLETIQLFGLAVAVLTSGGCLAFYRPQLISFVISVSIVACSGLAYQKGSYYSLLILAFVILIYCLLVFGKTQSDAAYAAIKLSFQTERLLKERIEQQQLTDQARAEAERALKQAEIANQGKTTFLAAAGHDLRQPMHALVQYVGHLKRRNRDESLNDTITRIGKSLEAMQDLMDTILEMSKLMMGAVRPNVTKFRVSSVLDRLDVQLRPLAEDKGLTFNIIENDSIVETDEILLERILRNLTLNAIRYTVEGTVTVRCGRRRGHLSVQIWDTGVGIQKDQIGKIFEEFYQISNKARDSRKGLGLGLSLARQLSDLLGHRLRVKSSIGKGSVFLIEVPMAAALDPVQPIIQSAVLPDYVRGACVVLIDDNEASLDATSATLREFGCKVVSARSGLEALSRLEGQETMPQMIISDYRLEDGETGIDAIKMVVDNQRAVFGDEFTIQAVVMSGDTAPGELIRVQEAGYPMLHKPVKVEILYRTINEKLRQLARESIEA